MRSGYGGEGSSAAVSARACEDDASGGRARERGRRAGQSWSALAAAATEMHMHGARGIVEMTNGGRHETRSLAERRSQAPKLSRAHPR